MLFKTIKRTNLYQVCWYLKAFVILYCAGVKCFPFPLPNPENGYWDGCVSNKVFQHCRIQCNPDYAFRGKTAFLRCNDNGYWDYWRDNEYARIVNLKHVSCISKYIVYSKLFLFCYLLLLLLQNHKKWFQWNSSNNIIF